MAAVPPQERYQKLNKIGEGSCGVVFRCRCRQTGRIVAIKKVRFAYEEPGGSSGGPSLAGAFGASALVLREVALLKSLSKHRGIVPLWEVYAEAGKLYMIFEYFEHDLARYMHDAGPLSDRRVCRFAWQLIAAMAHCHAHRVAHRDVKPQNILVKLETDEVKLCDFSLARSVVVQPTVSQNPETHKVASLWYRGPEILLASEQCGHCGVRLDVWSLGCVIAEMVLNEPLFPGSSEIGMLFHQFKLLGTPDEMSWPGVTSLANWSDQFPHFRAGPWHEKVQSNPAMHNLISSLVCCCPAQRQSAGALLGHSVFRILDPSLPSLPSHMPGSDCDMPEPRTSEAERCQSAQLYTVAPQKSAIEDVGEFFHSLKRENPTQVSRAGKKPTHSSLFDDWHLNTQIRGVR
ncbi:CDC2 [Symbiodinium natans]|uniref:Cyclin-dependent kinase 2 homolog n=1 Tax=Symbiodinium natans TaxID=878477 RepID=A0A812UHW3_9DINO|nr:CDC2 [Symbiodinium natans]